MIRRLVLAGYIGSVWSGATFAADLPLPMPIAAAPIPIFNWTGPYSGLFAGYGHLDNTTHSVCTGPGGAVGDLGCPIVGTGRAPDDAFIAGGELGYNRQFEIGSGLVIGGVADYQFTRLRNYGLKTGDFPAVGGEYPFSIAHAGQRLDYLTTVRGKIGFASDRVFVYATAGLAAGNVRIDTNTSVWGVLPFDGRKGEFRTGYVAGAGIEYAFSQRLSAKIEGLYYDLGEQTVRAPDSYGAAPGYLVGTRVATNGFLTRVGLNYRFGDGLPFLPPTDLADSTPIAPGVWSFEAGARYFYSSGTHRYTLGDPYVPGQVNSRLTYKGYDAQAGESFARLDHNPTGLFAKGFLGSGEVLRGSLHDEDFPPGNSPYSNTVSQIKNGDIGYAAIDAGVNVFDRDNVKIGGFVGYQYFSELANGFGCRQVAGGEICAGDTAVGGNVKGLTENARWNALRIGLIGEVRFDRLKISLEGAYLPVVAMDGVDRHWLRPDINPLPQRGTGDGYFVEGIVSYDVTPSMSIGVGGRYWRMQASPGRTQFPAVPPSPTKFETDRYGGFAQVSYKLSDMGFGAPTGQPVLQSNY
ncbi:Opacity protein [Methylobacterium sp. 190mf]|uniref:omptin family outer membrane protease n=1 Tax=Methylobacterium sp. 190mf TaxID=1761798 RepID=UPI00089F2FA8|nr:omptin family outer membrane protease [Methylobacterium sp. 190mf]SEG64288.1 Opacity protein [Methylobacterium sp. 190mf]